MRSLLAVVLPHVHPAGEHGTHLCVTMPMGKSNSNSIQKMNIFYIKGAVTEITVSMFLSTEW